MSTGVDIDALIQQGEAEEKRLRNALIAAGYDEIQIAEVVGAMEASFQKSVTSEERERFASIYQAVIANAETADGRSARRLPSRDRAEAVPPFAGAKRSGFAEIDSVTERGNLSGSPTDPSAPKAIRSSSVDLATGTLLGGKYRLSRRIGQGAMSAVWAAVNQDTSCEVAVKLILGSEPELRQRLMREARSCGALKHPNVIDIYDVAQTASGEPFLVMEFLTGETLAQLLTRKRRLEPMEAARIALAVARALEAAHALGIVHRDIKPANVFLHAQPGEGKANPVVKVLDFGVAKNVASDDGLRTSLGGLVGSPAYMSPEQARADSTVDHRSDIWSLGILLFEMLAGVRPFTGDLYLLLSHILKGPIPTLAEVVRDADPQLSEIIARCLKRDRDHRLSSAAQLIELLEPILNGRATEGAAAVLPERSGRGKSNAIGARMDFRMVANLAGRSARVMNPVALRREQPGALDEAKLAIGAPSTPPPPIEEHHASPPRLSSVARVQAGSKLMEARAVVRKNSTTTAPLPYAQGKPPSPFNLLRVFGAILFVTVGVVGLDVIPRPLPVEVSIPTIPMESPPLGKPSTASIPVEVSIPAVPMESPPLGQPSPPSMMVPGVDAVLKRVEVIVLPADAFVEVKGIRMQTKSGIFEITGTVGSVHQVRVFKGNQASTTSVIITEGGASPHKVELTTVEPGPVGSPPEVAAPPRNPPSVKARSIF
jgi:serine/threonine protein kinase